jgi:hypothetical protein
VRREGVGSGEVNTNRRLEPGQVYLCLSASNPKYVDPILVPELYDE